MFKRPALGFVLDKKYRLLERIGGGGMGDVFRAEVVEKGKRQYAMRQSGPAVGACVAIKVLHPELASSSDVATRFFHEARAVNRVRHPNIVEIIEIGTADVGPYLVMEYLEGESIGSVLNRKGRLGAHPVIAITIPVLEALDAAHRAGIVHRDLKPENVFLAKTDHGAEVRLLDFGIAKVMAESTTGPKTRTGVVYGTPDYLSPEQATGEGVLDGRSDLFAVGVLAYELLSGRRPFSAPTAVATAFRVVHAEPTSFADCGVVVEPRLAAIVHRLLEKEPADRYAHAADASRALEGLLSAHERRPESLRDIRSSLARRATASSDSTPGSSAPGSSAPGSSVPGSATRAIPQESLPGSGRTSPAPPSPSAAAAAPMAAPPAPLRQPSAPMGHSSSIRPSQSTGQTTGELEREESSTTLRPLPLEFRGKYQVLGIVMNSVDSAVRLKFGEAKRNAVLDQLPAPYRSDIRNGIVNALVGFDLEVLELYLNAATSLAFRDELQWRYVGGMAVDGGLAGMLRTLSRPASLESMLRRGLSIFSRFMNFGVWSIEGRPSGRVCIHIDAFEPASLPLRLWLVGVVEEVARRAQNCDVRVHLTSGDVGFTPNLSWELTPLYGSSAVM